MEAVPRMPMIWLDLKEAGEFQFSSTVKQFILKNYGEDPDNYNEPLKKLEQLRQSAVNVTRDFEGCSTLRKYFGQLHYLQSRVPLGPGQEAAVPVSWTEIFSGKTVTHDDISYEQACILYNLGALHSMLGAMDNRVSEEGMKVSCTHFQCSAGAFTYLRDHFSHNYSVDMSHQILNLNINLMLGQAQECLLEKSMLDNRKSFLVARISAQVVDYYKEACRALENSDTASMLGKIQKDWKKLVQMKIYYFAAIAHLHMGKQAEEQQKYGERLAYLQSSLDKLNEAIKLAKGQPDSVQEALRFTMDVIGGKFNSAKKDNDFIYHEAVPSLETLPSVKGAPLVKALPVNPTDPSVTGPDIFSKLVPMAAHEASSLYSEEKAKLLRDIMAKIESKNETLEQFMDSLNLDPDSVDNMDMYNSIPSVLMEKCAALSVRPDTVKSLIQSMQVLSGVFTDVEASLREIRSVLDDDEAGDRKLEEVAGKQSVPAQPAAIAELRRDLEKYVEAHEKASFTNTELHRAMNLHISNLRLLGGPLDTLREALPRPQLSEDEVAGLQCMKRILGKVQEMKDQRSSLEKQLRELIQQDDITAALVTTERADMKRLFEEQLKKYEQVKVYIDQNLAAQENILKALTDANVQYATVRKSLAETEHKWNSTVQMLVASYEAYEDLMKKSQEGKEFYEDLDAKASRLLERAKTICKTRDEERQAILEKELQKKVPQRPTAPKPAQKKAPDMDSSGIEDPEIAKLNAAILALGGDLPEDLRSLPPELALPMIPEGFHPGAAALYLPPRFPPNLPPPELLAQISRFTTLPPTQRFNHNLPPGPLPQQHQVPQMPNPQVARLPSLPGYRPPSLQTQPAVLGPPAPIRTSTTTVDSVQTPIPSYTPAPGQPAMPAPTPGHPMPTPAVYNPPLPVASQPQYLQQPGVPVNQPPQGLQASQPQSQPRQPFPQVHGQGQPQPSPPQPFFQQQIPAPVTGPQLPQQTQPHYLHHMAQQRPHGPPNLQQRPFNIHTTPSALPQPQQVYPPVSFVPGCQPVNAIAPNQLPHHSMPPQMPPSSQPMPQVSMPHLPNVKQQMPPCSQPYMPTVSQQVHPIPPPQTPLSSQQVPPASHGQMPPTVQQIPPHSQPQMPPSSSQMSPPTHLQMPAASQPVLHPSCPPVSAVSQSLPHPSRPPVPSVSQPLPHPSHQQIHPPYQPAFPTTTPRVPVPVQPQLPPASLSAQFPVHTNALPSQPHGSLPSQLPPGPRPSVPPQMTQQPMTLPQHHLPPHSTPVGYPGGIPIVPHQSTVPQQPQALPQQVPSGAPASYPGPHAGIIPPGPIQHSGPVVTPGLQSLPQGMIPPSSAAPGATPSSVLSAPSPSPSPGPSSLSIVPQRPSPALTPVAGAAIPPTATTPLPSSGPLPSSNSLFQHQNSSTDDLLSSSPESQHGGSKDTANVLLPTKADPQDEQLRKKSEGVKIIQGDPYQAPERVSQLCAELERFRSTVQSLERPSGEGGLSELDARWKELQDQQEKDSRQLSIAIARCYTMKNRHQDVMPYDCNRVVLHSGKDDYINASFIEDLSPYCPRLIATQAPLTGTAADFWLMVYEQKVSLIVMLVSEQELEKQKVLRYFPSERGQQITQGSITLSLTTQKNTATHIERMIGLQYRDQSLKRTVIHLQFTSWPELGLPESKSNLIRFIQEVHGHYLLQRPLHTPVVVHCSSGVGRTGAFCLLYAALQELEAGNGIPDLSQLVRKMRQQRKNMLQEKLHLKFCYEAVLKHAEQVLQRRGIITTPSQKSTNSAAVKYSQPEAQDIVLGGDMPISSIQATVARLSIRPPSAESDQDPNQDPMLSVAAGLEPEFSLVQDLQATSPTDTVPASLSPPISSPASPGKMQSPSPPNHQGNGFEGSTPMPVSNNHAAPEAAPPAPSSLDLLASLTPEAFTLDSGCRGKQRISKQSFFQAQDGQGLQGPPNGDDPLSTLDPLWTLNKS
ncbi:tyrosine-protein phosphatase non-receptor type 23 isoform X2 [Pangasianodon hypophthalmus]|uniref:tyrosine-protein phosphatase non-receptor type 23 isoform X2 n=1 Tax=Pangasianodon hypophthalmus TaxID=310915 RepID=UPI0023070507|nr:tyrosine-protein phosphatase non-receptor type 23 isoform X2 [Pangasianodon hypophthalmus]